MPEGIDASARRWADEGSFIDDIFVAERDTEAADDKAREVRDYGEGQALRKGIRTGHRISLAAATASCT
jgi:hypothetical protein